MIQSITIENFKGIREPVTLELKPVTLLFGANSSGKSTLLQALHYAHEVFERNNLNADETLRGGRAVELGGFRNFVHRRDTSKAITFTFKVNTSRERVWPDDEVEGVDEGLHTRWQMWSLPNKGADVSVTIHWSHLLKRPLVTRYAVSYGGELFAEINSTLDGRQVNVEKLNLAHHGLLHDKTAEEVDDAWSAIKDSLNSKRWAGAIPVEGTRGALPDFENGMHVSWDYFEENDANMHVELAWLLNYALTAPGRTIRNDLRNYRYIGPVREIPRRNHVPVLSEDHWRWANGLAAWDLLSSAPTEFVETVNAWLGGDDRLHCGYTVKRQEVKEVDVENPFLRALLNKSDDLEAVSRTEVATLKAELESVPVHPQLTLVDEHRRLDVKPQDIGVGISQVLPVVVGCLDPAMRILAVEQPELHIHPALQARLGDLFIAETQMQITPEPPTRGWHKRVILETHSEHLILRLLRRIRETTEGKLPPGSEALQFKPVDLQVYYVEPGTAEAGMKLTALRVDETGEFIDRWPAGFFEERAKELF